MRPRARQLAGKGYVYRGLKPVNWCFDCGSALAEAEVEYENKRDPSIDGFPFAEQDKLATAFGLDKLPHEGYCVIWTTTPWTIPSNQALNMHPKSLTLWSRLFVTVLTTADPGTGSGSDCLAKYELDKIIASCWVLL
jgi:isoleucyl-tRNA synthetase